MGIEQHFRSFAGVSVLRSKGVVPFEVRDELFAEAASMMIEEVDELTLHTPDYEGRIYTNGKHLVLGALSGKHFEAEIETSKGKYNITFLVGETQRSIQRNGITYSMN